MGSKQHTLETRFRVDHVALTMAEHFRDDGHRDELGLYGEQK